MVSFVWSPLATVLVFVAAQTIALAVFLYRRQQERQKIIKLLIIEIEYSLKMGGQTIHPSIFSDWVQNISMQELNAYAMVAQQPRIYEKVIGDLWRLEQNCAKKIVEFYVLFDRINAFISHFKSREFLDPPLDLQAKLVLQAKMKDFLIKTHKEMYDLSEEIKEGLSV